MFPKFPEKEMSFKLSLVGLIVGKRSSSIRPFKAFEKAMFAERWMLSIFEI